LNDNLSGKIIRIVTLSRLKSEKERVDGGDVRVCESESNRTSSKPFVGLENNSRKNRNPKE